MSTQNLTILGSTGSIGASTLDVVSRHPDRFRIFALAGHSQTEKLAAQCLAHRPRYAVTADAARAEELRGLLRLSGCQTEVLHGGQALSDVATAPETDGVMAAIVGAAGLPPTLA
ncbi:MAG: 1-deoxy-D-xylulose-5-phosphate reductoisomerase, partial [Kingella sp. (in: b-proteobacteria)]